MSTDSYLEHFVLLLGWLINNSIWDIILATGLFALPLVFKMIAIWQKVREEGDDEGNKGVLALPRVEHTIYIAYLVMLFCVIPTHQINLSTMRFDTQRSKQCGIQVIAPQESGYGALVSDFDGKVAHVPVWWYFVHSISKGVTRASISSIPCGQSFRQLRFQIQHQQVRDPILRNEIQEFADQCYARAYYRLKAVSTQLSPAVIASVSWIGSHYFLSEPGYYDHYSATKPQALWAYDPVRDEGLLDVKRGGYPSCKEWWSSPSNGLKNRVLSIYDVKILNAAKARFGHGVEEAILRNLVSPKNLIRSGDGASYTMGKDESVTGFGNSLTRVVATLGTGVSQIKVLPSIDAMKQALPIVQSLIEMIIIITIPLILMLSAYNPKTLITITFALFAVYFTSFWWELAGWLDDRLIDIIYNSLRKSHADNSEMAIKFIGSTYDGWIMNIIMGSMYVLIPMIWFSSLSWAGITIGAAFSTMLNKASAGVQSAGEQGGKIATKVANKASSTAIKKR